MLLTKTPLHEMIAGFMDEREPNWPKIMSEFQNSQAFYSWNKKRDLGNIVGYFSEKHVRIALEESVEQLGVKDDVSFDPIPHGAETNKFNFYRDPLGRLACREKDGNCYSDIDELIIVRGVPTLVDVKLQSSKSHGNKKRSKNQGTFLNLNSVNRAIAPLKEYFDTDKIGYMYVAPKYHADPNISHVKKMFVNEGGIIIPFYSSRQQYRIEVSNRLNTFTRKMDTYSTWKPFENLELPEGFLK